MNTHRPGIRIDATDARIPLPTEDLVSAMALEMYDVFRLQMEAMTQTKLVPADNMPDLLFEAWQLVAKRGYAVVALFGGAVEADIVPPYPGADDA